MSLPSLAHTQQLLWTLITAPEGAAAGLAQLAASERGAAEALVRPERQMSAVERLDVYADMYFYRLRDCLAEDFVSLRAVVGDAPFHNLVTDYLIVHPPTHFSLRYAGQHLPAFIAAHRLSQRWPYLANLAALEWAILDAFDAPDEAPIEASTLAQVPEQQWPELRLRLIFSLHLLHCDWPVHDVWHAVQAGAAPPELQPAATWLRVWRQELRVFHRAIDSAEAAALTALRHGASFAEVCDTLAATDPSADAQRAFTLFNGWIGDGLLSSSAALPER